MRKLRLRRQSRHDADRTAQSPTCTSLSIMRRTQIDPPRARKCLTVLDGVHTIDQPIPAPHRASSSKHRDMVSSTRSNARTPIAVVPRKVRSPEKRPPIRRQHSGQRPSTLPADRLHRRLVALSTSGRSSRSTFTATKCSLMSGASSHLHSSRDPSRGTSGTTPRRYPAEPACLSAWARANAASPQACQFTGWWRADRR